MQCWESIKRRDNPFPGRERHAWRPGQVAIDATTLAAGRTLKRISSRHQPN